MRNQEISLITVTMHLSDNVRPIDSKWYIKFERDIIQIISVPAFSFASKSMNVAVTKVADLVSRHPENYFKEITIR